MSPLAVVNAWHTCPKAVPDLFPVGKGDVLLEWEAAAHALELVRRRLTLEEYLT